MYNQVTEQHTEAHLNRALQFMTTREPFHVQAQKGLFTLATPPPLPPMPPVPKPQWFLAVYVRDVVGRMEQTKAKVTTIFGIVLKMDSTKKVVKKLAGKASNTASWCTNVGNEFGQVLMSVLTDGEGDFLDDMVDGLVARYDQSHVEPPKVLYVDRDCCAAKLQQQFGKWPELVVRLDVWHFMRRIAVACCSESHPLYDTFMVQLSAAIFEWDPEDVSRLAEAKKQELSLPSCESAMDSIKRLELAAHCKRQTRGFGESCEIITNLISTYSSHLGNDTMGIPLLDATCATAIWEEQKRHLPCIPDPDGVNLYQQTGSITKGGILLPVYRCARGSTSLESFHNHIVRFIPGTTASDMHYQAYLLEGIVRWNEDRGRAMVKGENKQSRQYNAALCHEVNRLSAMGYGQVFDTNYRDPGKYTGEKIGVEYLYSQTGKKWEDDLDFDPDEPDMFSAT